MTYTGMVTGIRHCDLKLPYTTTDKELPLLAPQAHHQEMSHPGKLRPMGWRPTGTVLWSI